MNKYNLKNCKCGHKAEVIGEAPAKAVLNEDGDYLNIWFTDVVWYSVRCTDCDLETDTYYTIEKACGAWNEDKLSKY